MADRVTQAQRSKIMSAVGSRDTAPERRVRSILHRMGYRFRLHGDLPGRPDIVLPRYRAVVFVHGCFWHRHARCRFATVPATNARFWRLKFERNVERDRAAARRLRRAGWTVITIWECQLRHPEAVADRLRQRLERLTG